MEQVKQHGHSWMSYGVVMALGAVLAALYWKACNVAVDSLARHTTSPQIPARASDSVNTTKQPSAETEAPKITGRPLTPGNKPDPKLNWDAPLPPDVLELLRKSGIDPKMVSALPNFDPMKVIPAGALKIYLGTSVGFTSATVQVVMRVAKRDLLKIHRVDGGISIDAQIFGRDGKIMADIERNDPHVNDKHADYWRTDRPDEHTLVVHDQHGDKVLTVEYINSRSMKVLGAFRYSGIEIIISADSMTLNGKPWLVGAISGDNGGSLFNVE